VALIQPAKDSKIKGKVTFEQTDAGLKLTADIEGLPQGTHAFHVHAFGDCSSDDASSAGPHFDFKGSFQHQQGSSRITGDLGNLQADANGKAHLDTTISEATLQGPYTIIGRSIVVHEMQNDPSKPPEGGAGGRIGCGVIGIEQR
jgi:Cu-Zn family superoxide dismutase